MEEEGGVSVSAQGLGLTSGEGVPVSTPLARELSLGPAPEKREEGDKEEEEEEGG